MAVMVMMVMVVMVVMVMVVTAMVVVKMVMVRTSSSLLKLWKVSFRKPRLMPVVIIVVRIIIALIIEIVFFTVTAVTAMAFQRNLSSIPSSLGSKRNSYLKPC